MMSEKCLKMTYYIGLKTTSCDRKYFKSKSYTRNKIKSFSKQLIESGTLSGGCYSSIHSHATELAIKHFPGEIVVGNVQMTMNSPDYLCKLKKCLEITKKFKHKV